MRRNQQPSLRVLAVLAAVAVLGNCSCPGRFEPNGLGSPPDAAAGPIELTERMR